MQWCVQRPNVTFEWMNSDRTHSDGTVTKGGRVTCAVQKRSRGGSSSVSKCTHEAKGRPGTVRNILGQGADGCFPPTNAVLKYLVLFYSTNTIQTLILVNEAGLNKSLGLIKSCLLCPSTAAEKPPRLPICVVQKHETLHEGVLNSLVHPWQGQAIWRPSLHSLDSVSKRVVPSGVVSPGIPRSRPSMR